MREAEQAEIAVLKKEIVKLKAERDILRTVPGPCPPVRGQTACATLLGLGGSDRQPIGGSDPVKKPGPWVHAHLRVVTPRPDLIPVRKMKDGMTHALLPDAEAVS